MSPHDSNLQSDFRENSEVKEDPILVSSRREAVIVLVVFLIALFWSVMTSYTLGYNIKAEELTYVLGFPHWVFWGIIVPWGTMIVFSLLFGAFLVRDEDLGPELEEQSDF
ncbi:MAG: DUF997 family protein [Planctomycetaceae bacterium]